jgi:tRNA(Arg) A34 adenosine deaminase TadA
MYDDAFMQRAIEVSHSALGQAGCEPFGAIVVKDGKIVGEGLNRSLALHDPTSHGEVEAIRDACRKLGTKDLDGCDLYSSCEPCSLCVAAMHIAGISRLYYAVSLEQSWAALKHLPQDKRRYRMTAAELRAQVGLPAAERKMPSESHRAEDAQAVLEAWARAQGEG